MNELRRNDLVKVVMYAPQVVIEMIKDRGLFLAGGFIRSTIEGTPPADIDLLGPSIEVLDAASVSLQAHDRDRQRPSTRFSTENAITVISPPRLPVQFITRWLYNDPLQLINSFDFTVCQAVVWFDGSWKSLCSEFFYSDLAARRLVYTSPVREEAPGGSLLRAFKFVHKGWHIEADSIASLCSRVFKTISPLEDEDSQAKAILRILREVDPLRILDGEVITEGGEVVKTLG